MISRCGLEDQGPSASNESIVISQKVAESAEQGDPTTVDGRRILERHALMQQLNHRDRKEHSVRNPSWEIHGLNSVCSITSPQASEFVLSA